VLNGTLTQKCPDVIGFQVAMSGKWCPATLQEYIWLEQYYAQFVLEEATARRVPFPSDVFVNDIGEGGGMFVGNGLGYALADAVLLSNVRTACDLGGARGSDLCAATEASLLQRKSLHPLQVWRDDDRGRRLVPPT